jgi:hypothetical protein
MGTIGITTTNSYQKIQNIGTRAYRRAMRSNFLQARHAGRFALYARGTKVSRLPGNTRVQPYYCYRGKHSNTVCVVICRRHVITRQRVSCEPRRDWSLIVINFSNIDTLYLYVIQYILFVIVFTIYYLVTTPVHSRVWLSVPIVVVVGSKQKPTISFSANTIII